MLDTIVSLFFSGALFIGVVYAVVLYNDLTKELSE